MRISFDLDDTLICYQPGTPREPRPAWYWRAIASAEPLRAGARALLRALAGRGCELWVYTTSHRPPLGVKVWLRAHGVRVRRVVNQDVHDRYLRRACGIGVDVEDADGVRMEGDKHGFRVVVVSPDDPAWADKVRAAVEVCLTGAG